MTMRMVLVGLVAALGVTTPTPTQCSQWLASIHALGSAMLADWDHWTPREKYEGRSAFRLTPVAARRHSDGDQNWWAVGGTSRSPLGHEPHDRDERLIAAHHVKYPKPDEVVASQNEVETWPDLPADVFENPPLVFGSSKESAPAQEALPNLAQTTNDEEPAPAPAVAPKQVEEIKNDEPAPAPARAPHVVEAIKNDEPAPAPTPSLLLAESIKNKNHAPMPANSPKSAEIIRSDEFHAVNVRYDDLATQKPGQFAERIPFGRSDDLQAWLLAGLLQTQEMARPEIAADSTVMPSAAPHPAQVAAKTSIGAFPVIDESTGLDWDEVAAASVQPLQPEPSMAESERVETPVEGVETPVVDSDGDFDNGSQTGVLSWAEATGNDRVDSTLGLGAANSPLSARADGAAISAELKHAVILTRDAFSAWMNLVRRGSTFKVTTR